VLRAGLWIFAGLVALWLVTAGSWLSLFGLASGAAGVYLLWTSGRGLLAGRDTPNVALSSSELAIGEPFALQWGPDALEGHSEVTAWLICRETARRSNAPGAGEADVHEWVVREVSQDAPADRVGGVSLAIPDDAMHSFRAGHNAVDWLVEVELRPRRGSVARTSLPLTVRPRLHGEATDGA
jgi:hypothetical protein